MTTSWACRSLAVRSTACKRIVGGHDQRLDLFAGQLRALHHRRHQLLVVAGQLRPAIGLCRHPTAASLAVITTRSVVSGSVSARAFSSMDMLCGERMATSLR